MKKIKKYNDGGKTPKKPYRGSISRSVPLTDMSGSKPRMYEESEKVENAKVRSVSNDKKYVTKVKTDASGNITKLKSRRTVKGFLTGAPKVKDNLKRGGVVKKKK